MRYEEREKVVYDVSCGDARDVSVIVCGCNFDDVCATGWWKLTLVRKVRGLLLRLRTYTKLRPARPRMIRLTSRVVQPPASGVPATNKIEISGSAARARAVVFCTHLLVPSQGLP